MHYECPCGGDHARQEPDDPKTRQLWTQLESKLTAIGGHRAVWVGEEPNLARLVQRGQTFEGRVIMKPGSIHDQYENTARAWGKDVERTQLVTDYVLNDGRWRPHDWVVRDGAIWEFGPRGEWYFGVPMTEAQALAFWMRHFAMPRYPDTRNAFHKLGKKYPGPMAILDRLQETTEEIGEALFPSGGNGSDLTLLN